MPGGLTVAAGGMPQGGRAISAVAASPGLAIGVLHMPVPSNGATRQAGDPSVERAAFDEAVTRAIERLRALAGESGGLARDVIGFQISLLEDEEFLGPVWAEIEAGAAADRAWGDHLAREIADYESAPTDYLRDRAVDLRDLRGRIRTAFAGDAHLDALPEQCIVVADELTPSGFLELDRSRAVGGGDVLRKPGQPRGDARAGTWPPDAGAARVRTGRADTRDGSGGGRRSGSSRARASTHDAGTLPASNRGTPRA